MVRFCYARGLWPCCGLVFHPGRHGAFAVPRLRAGTHLAWPTHFLMDVALLFFLIVLNAGFAMSEMALTTSRKARLQVMLEAGEHGVEAAIDLHDHPTKFLSTVQVGITSISVLNGIVGDAAFSEPLGEWLHAT